MFTLEKAEKILNVIYEEYPSLKNELINIKYGDQFSVEMLLGYDISIINKFSKDDTMTKYMYNYLEKNYNFNDSDYMFYDFLETFSFIHEIGHIYYYDLIPAKEEKIMYSNFKNKAYNSYKEGFVAYRNIPVEKNADQFAINILRNKKAEIWSIMQGITIEQAQNEIEFWSM